MYATALPASSLPAPSTPAARRIVALRAAADLFVRQHGVATRCQLIDCGMSPRQIERRLAEGRLGSLARGVYVLCVFPDCWERRAVGAVLVTTFRSRPAALSHDSAAAAWGIPGYERSGTVYLTAAVGDRHPNPLATMCRVTDLVAGDVVTGPLGVATTSVRRTVLDLATRTSRVDAVEDLLDRTLVSRLATLEELSARAEAMHGRPGITTVRRALRRRARDERRERLLVA